MASARQQVAENLADTCSFGGLNDSYGINVAKTEERGKTFWIVTFCKARILDGSIRVYSERFIQVKWQGMGAYGKGSEVFRDEAEAKAFLMKKFINV